MSGYATIDGRGLALQRFFRASPDSVWKALVDPQELERWLFAHVDVDLRVGGTLVFQFINPPRARVSAAITVLAPGSLLEYSWAKHHARSVVRWELARQSNGGTALTLTQTLEDEGDILDFAAGWHHHLEMLEALLELESLDPDRFRSLRADYERRQSTAPASTVSS